MSEPTQPRALSAYEQALCHLAHYDLQYHRLQSAVLGVLNSANPLTKYQSAVLTATLSELEAIKDEKTPDWSQIKGSANPEADALAATIQGVIDSACHPDIALRVISVELAPLRAALTKYRSTQSGGSTDLHAGNNNLYTTGRQDP